MRLSSSASDGGMIRRIRGLTSGNLHRQELARWPASCNMRFSIGDIHNVKQVFHLGAAGHGAAQKATVAEMEESEQDLDNWRAGSRRSRHGTSSLMSEGARQPICWRAAAVPSRASRKRCTKPRGRGRPRTARHGMRPPDRRRPSGGGGTRQIRGRPRHRRDGDYMPDGSISL